MCTCGRVVGTPAPVGSGSPRGACARGEADPDVAGIKKAPAPSDDDQFMGQEK